MNFPLLEIKTSIENVLAFLIIFSTIVLLLNIQLFIIKYMNKNSIEKIFTHFLICFYSKNISFNIVVTYKLFFHFWNMFNRKTIKIRCMIIFNIKTNPTLLCISTSIEIYYIFSYLFSFFE